MITSISISNRAKVPSNFACLQGCFSTVLFAVATTACASPPSKASDTQAAQSIEKADAPAPTVQAILSASFEKAVLGKDGIVATEKRLPGVTGFAMKCDPSRIASAKTALTITLPKASAERRHAFAVITPTGRLYELYAPYTDEVEQSDIIIPSDIISWQKARDRNIFTFAAADLFAVEPKKNVPTQVFQEAGIYKFALVSSIQKDLIAVSDTPGQVKVFAGCLIDWVL
jgi:hypothetical protein